MTRYLKGSIDANRRFTGRRHSEEAKRKMREAAARRWARPEERARIGESALRNGADFSGATKTGPPPGHRKHWQR
jgi:hypothetical protein